MRRRGPRCSCCINAASPDEIIFVRGATEAINLVAQSYGRGRLQAGDEIILSHMEHHSNIVPWQMLCQQTGARLRIVPIDDSGRTADGCVRAAAERAHAAWWRSRMSPIRWARSTRSAHRRAGACAAASRCCSTAPRPSPTCRWTCRSWIAISTRSPGTSCTAPPGVGVLYGKADLLDAMPPYQGGGDMIRSVSFEKTTYNTVPYKFEAGTPNIAGVIGLGAAIDYVSGIGFEAHRRARTGVAGLRAAVAGRDARAAHHRHRARKDRHPVLRAGGHASARHRHHTGPRGRGDPHRPSLHHAADGALRRAGHGARLARRCTTRGRKWMRWWPRSTRRWRYSSDERPARTLSGDHPRPLPPAAQLRAAWPTPTARPKASTRCAATG